jgi:hypothetical protein
MGNGGKVTRILTSALVEVNSQLHAPTTLPTGSKTQVTLG